MQHPLISIIIPTFNRASLLIETLDSVLGQSYVEWECIIVDDGSTDDTVVVVNNYVEKDSRFRYFHRPIDRPKGANACRNYGFEVSKGDYVNWFDDDDIMHSNKLLIQVKALLESDFPFSVCQTEVFENNLINSLGLRHPYIFSENPFYDFLTLKIIWLTNPVLWRKNFLLKQSYLFDESLHAAQEWEFHSRILLNIKNYHFTNEILVFNRKHINSISYNSNRKDRKFQYFLARLKIYNTIKMDSNFNLAKKYLEGYILDYFKQTIRNNEIKHTIRVYREFIKNENLFSLKDYIILLLAISSFSIFDRGNVLLKYVKNNEQ